MDAEDVMEEVDVDEIVDEEPEVIKKRRPKFSKADMERRKKQANSPENIEQLKAMREKAKKVAEEKRKNKIKEQAMELGLINEQKPVEPPKAPEPIQPPAPVVEPPKAPETKTEPPAPIPETPKKKEKPRRIPKPKKKKRVEYIDDEEEEEIEEPPMRPMTRQRQLTQRDVDDFIRNKYASMDLKDLEQRMAKQAYDFKYQRYKEEIMGNQIFGRY
jgi:hypothetical protein